MRSGGLAGYLGSLCGTESYVTISAKTDCFLGFLPVEVLQRILERRPMVLLTLAKRLISLLSPLVLYIDAALDWKQLEAGDTLFKVGDRSTDFFVIINGRLRALNDHEGVLQAAKEYGQNDSIGELDVITGADRSQSVQAIRDTEVVRIPAALFSLVSTKHPGTSVQLLRLMAIRARNALSGPRAGVGIAETDVGFKTVCVMGSTRDVPVTHFASRLKTALEQLGASTSYLDQRTVVRHMGRHAFARIGKLKVAGWLADQEQRHTTVLYVADTPVSSPWTLTCVRQADIILIISMGDDPSLGEYEKLILASKSTARKELILLHDERSVPSGSTRRWLKVRWCIRHSLRK